MTSHKTGYYAALAVFLASLALLLLTVVDVRRGFLFFGYFKVGAPSVLFNLDLRHLPMLLLGILGVWLAYRHMARVETNLKGNGIDLKALTRLVTVIIGVFLVVDLFTYRGVPASRFVAAGKMGVGQGTMGMGWAIPVGSFPGWLQPLGEGVNYLLVVWHATTVGILVGGLFLVAGTALAFRLRGNGFVTHLAGSALALPQPFCSCCAAPIGSALYRKGMGLGPMLAFTVSSPMLNITSLILAAAFLPTEFILLRTAGGLLVGVLVTYGVSLAAGRWSGGEKAEEAAAHGRFYTWSARLLDSYSRLFRFEGFSSERAADSPAALISGWLSMAGRLAKVVVPVFLVGSIAAAYIAKAMPDSGNNLPGVVATSFFATLLMVPTWTEIPLAAGLVNGGLSGIAAVALITLPAVSIPCLAVIAGAVRNMRVPVMLGLAVFVVGILAGIMFL
ncbi:MAG: permease [Chloroflexi bacterium]|nr:permease [Chloroflexota bacterium]